MANIIFPTKWANTKPPLGSQINWGHPLAKGLAGCWLINEIGGKLVRNLFNNQSSPTTKSIIKNGIIGSATVTNSNYLNHGNSNKFSLVIWTNYVSAAKNFYSRYASAESGLLIYMNDGLNAYILKAGVLYVQLVVPYYPSETGFKQIVFTCGVDGTKYYRNGKYEGYNSNTQNFISNTTTDATIFTPSTVTTQYMLVYPKRTLTKQDVKQLYAEPYCFIAPIKRRFYSIPEEPAVSATPYGYLSLNKGYW